MTFICDLANIILACFGRLVISLFFISYILFSSFHSLTSGLYNSTNSHSPTQKMAVSGNMEADFGYATSI